MIVVPFTQSDLGAGAKNLFASQAESGLYLLKLRWRRTALSGSGDAQLNVAWTESDGSAGSYSNGFTISAASSWEQTEIITLDHPSTVTAALISQGFSGTFSADLQILVARLREEGSD